LYCRFFGAAYTEKEPNTTISTICFKRNAQQLQFYDVHISKIMGVLSLEPCSVVVAHPRSILCHFSLFSVVIVNI